MTAALFWRDLLAWSFQILVLAAAGALAARLFGLRGPRARLHYWQSVLAICLLLPALESWRSPDTSVNVSTSSARLHAPSPEAPARHRLRFAELALAVVAAGALCRGIWLTTGIRRLRRYRRESAGLNPLPHLLASVQARLGVQAEFRLCDEVAGAVTFGLRRPVVLLPSNFLELPPPHQEAVVCHELLHVGRRDWLFTILEEMVRTALWFHPAVWWLLAQIHLAREQAVDHAVIGRTQAREQYLEALLAVAGTRAEEGLAPAPLFLRKRHLHARVVSILKEVSMSRSRTMLALAASTGLLFLAGWFAVGMFPLEAAAQDVADAAGVSVATGPAGLLHRAPVEYPREARQKQVQGTVVLEIQVNEKGAVSDARVVSGPEELRSAALSSVLRWHYATTVPITAQATIQFQMDPGAGSPVATPVRVPANFANTIVKQILVDGLPPAAHNDLLARLPVHSGDTLTLAGLTATMQAAREFDEHLTVSVQPVAEGANLRIGLASPGQNSGADVLRIRVGGNVQQNKLTYKPAPAYPAEAKEARVQGKVRLEAVIRKDGTIDSLQVLSGDPLLVASALETVKHWEYAPTLLNGEPVSVITRIDVNYTLSQ